ncbi:hypothetical protein AB0J21_18340 [Streptomyces sp. NPDC049954]|uniref:hypothetical protein n=1 Tax=Streptomyces sp. NPDC049954 TaxID=3155779 RepID=UPI00342712D8
MTRERSSDPQQQPYAGRARAGTDRSARRAAGDAVRRAARGFVRRADAEVSA